MRTYVLFKIYKFNAQDDRDARRELRSIKADGTLEDYYVSESLKEEQQRGLFNEVRKQVTGK